MSLKIVESLKELDACYKREAQDDQNVAEQSLDDDRDAAELIFEFGELVDKELFIAAPDSPYGRAPNVPAIESLRQLGVNVALTEEADPEGGTIKAVSLITAEGNGPFDYSY